MSVIVDINARQIFDSRGNPTVRSMSLRKTVTRTSSRSFWSLDRSSRGCGAYAMAESDYMGKGVLKAVENVNGEISDAYWVFCF